MHVNFRKSIFLGINLPNNFAQVASHLLSCSVAAIPFKFLGEPVGANPRRAKPVIDKVKSRLALWRGRLLFVGRNSS